MALKPVLQTPPTYLVDGGFTLTSLPVIVVYKNGGIGLATYEATRLDDDDEWLFEWYSHDSERWKISTLIEYWDELPSHVFTEKVNQYYEKQDIL